MQTSDKQTVKSILWVALQLTSFKSSTHLIVHTTIDFFCNNLIRKKMKKPVNTEFYGPIGFGWNPFSRGGKIRTCDLLLPKQAR